MEEDDRLDIIAALTSVYRIAGRHRNWYVLHSVEDLLFGMVRADLETHDRVLGEALSTTGGMERAQ